MINTFFLAILRSWQILSIMWICFYFLSLLGVYLTCRSLLLSCFTLNFKYSPCNVMFMFTSLFENHLQLHISIKKIKSMTQQKLKVIKRKEKKNQWIKNNVNHVNLAPLLNLSHSLVDELDIIGQKYTHRSTRQNWSQIKAYYLSCQYSGVVGSEKRRGIL